MQQGTQPMRDETLEIVGAKVVTEALGGVWLRTVGKAVCPICDRELLAILNRRPKVIRRFHLEPDARRPWLDRDSGDGERRPCGC
jgi:hypothetical protein